MAIIPVSFTLLIYLALEVYYVMYTCLGPKILEIIPVLLKMEKPWTLSPTLLKYKVSFFPIFYYSYNSYTIN